MTPGRSTQVDSNRELFRDTLVGVARGVRDKRPELRYHVARELWSVTKRFGSSAIDNVDLRELPDVQDQTIDAYVDDRNRAVLAALCRAVGAQSFFEIGTNRGRTAWTVARNNPGLQVVTLDLPGPDAAVALNINDSDRAFIDSWASGEAFHGTAEEQRITPLFGDSAAFDFSSYAESMDVVYVDGAHSYSYAKSDTAAAFQMLRPGGTIVWDDYPAIPGVYRWLNELALTIRPAPFHILGTRLVVYSGHQLLRRLTPEQRQPDVA